MNAGQLIETVLLALIAGLLLLGATWLARHIDRLEESCSCPASVVAPSCYSLSL